MSFAGQLHAALDRISDRETDGGARSGGKHSGELGIALNDVMADMRVRPMQMGSGAQQAGRRVSEVMSMQV